MGWASGSRLFGAIVESLQDIVDDKELRKEIYKPIFHAFLEADWDTYDEVEGIDPAYDEVLKEWLISKGWWEDEMYDDHGENDE